MRNPGSVRGFCAGVVVGVMIGSAGLAAAAFGYNGWQKFSQDFKVGYVFGFLEMANLARNLDPGGYLDIKYPMVPKAKPVHWADEVNRLYADPANQKYSMTSIMQLASHELQKKFGSAPSPEERTRRRMEQQLEALRRKREALGLAEKDPKRQAIAPEKVVEPSPAAPAEPKKKKWCRCDGKDPAAERARRRAEAPRREEREEKEFLEWAAKTKAEKEAAARASGQAPGEDVPKAGGSGAPAGE